MSYFDSYGQVEYRADWRVILVCDTNISKYYRALYKSYSYNVDKLSPPFRGVHITLAKEEPKVKEFWRKRAGQNFWFRLYSSRAETNTNAIWFPVYCEAGQVLRKELGLAPLPEVDFHLCIGYKNFGRVYDE